MAPIKKRFWLRIELHKTHKKQKSQQKINTIIKEKHTWGSTRIKSIKQIKTMNNNLIENNNYQQKMQR